jgi:O-antigen/teichoic acid export membrane protein
VLLARKGGPAVVGIYALLRVLPGLVGVLLSAGLPGAAAYFLAGPTRGDRSLPLTLVLMAAAGGAIGAALWAAGAAAIRDSLFRDLSIGLVAWAGLTVLTQLIVATAKSCSQGTDDLPGANRVIVFEELMFLPAYLALGAVVHGMALVIGALLAADVLTGIAGWTRLARRGFFRGATAPRRSLAVRVAGYGLRGQLGGVLSLLNLRLDFAILDAIAGAAVLGPYAIASKFAELLRIPTVALTYVLYPSFARDPAATAARRARDLLVPAAVGVAVLAVPLAVAAAFLLPAVYGAEFRPAIVPAQILLVGLSAEGAAAVVSGFLYGVGRPGANSLAIGVGVVVTVVLDALLIPHHGAVGAAIASAVAYLSTCAALLLVFRRLAAAIRPYAPAAVTA